MRVRWAMNASFYMMYCPENPEVKAMYEAVHTDFGPMDYGFQMENHNHHDSPDFRPIGSFTIFDWSNGVACTSLYEFMELNRQCAEKEE